MAEEFPSIEFGLTVADRDASARLALSGVKRATTSLLAGYAFDREPVPVAGLRSVVRDGRGRKIAVIETVRVETRRFCDVDAVYAAIEGEGDGSLAHWQRLHRIYFGAECVRVGVPWSETIEVVLDYFRLVQPLIALAEF
jgi:uncharacterized protein YhfF